ncbi:DUF1054 domain-containing protein [Lacticaseibacillus parakribbianus]|uniref:DUF1054 domain-containing protein n=1 Tax=Lacticaseibacillus parakribbianus TaxID=2970927 RepID=UPI0021CB1962|nr:DUF1054 domain-containing protein [Lacticaseibacillus parakribbianus]
MFDRDDFAPFADPTLPGRLGLIRQRLDPKFEAAGAVLQTLLAAQGVPTQFLHLARHARRHKNPPPDTWLALSAGKRGYKMLPHLELGLWDDRLFLWVALLAESKGEPALRPAALRPLALALPGNFELSGDHTKKAVLPLNEANFDRLATRFETTAKAEFLIGQTYLLTDPLFDAPDELWADIQERVVALAPLYRALLA